MASDSTRTISAISPTSVGEIASQWFLSIVQEEKLVSKIREGVVGADVLHDLSRVVCLSSMRKSLATSPGLADSLVRQLEQLTKFVRGEGGESDKKMTGAVGAVLLVRVAKKLLWLEEEDARKDRILQVARSLFKLRAEFDRNIIVGLAQQLVSDPVVGSQAIDWLLENHNEVEGFRSHYFATSSLSELHARIRERWDDQHKRDGLDDLQTNLEQFGGLSPFLHASPAPGGVGDTAVLVRQFARALELKKKDETTRELRSWIRDAGRAQRLIQWELCGLQEGRYVALGANRNLVTIPDDAFLEELTRAWWRHLLEYEPLTFGRPIKRSEVPRTVEPAPDDIFQGARMSLHSFRTILNDPEKAAPTRDLQSINVELVRREWDRGGGSFVLHDGELTFCTLGWLWSNELRWRWPTLNEESGIDFDELSGTGFLIAAGLGLAADQEILFTPRWRSFARWLQAVAEMTESDRASLLRGWKPAEDFDANVANMLSLGLNRARAEAVLDCLGHIAAAAAPGDRWKPDENRVPFLAAEVFLRAYRPWPSQLVVSTVHAQRSGFQIEPLSFGFATVIGDFPLVFRQDSVGDRAWGSASTDSWLANQCSLLAGMGTALGVSIELARTAEAAEYSEYAEQIWPAKTMAWFDPNSSDGVAHNSWDADEDDWERVIDHLVELTGAEPPAFPAFTASDKEKSEFWEEMKSFFGRRQARIQRGDNPLTLNSVWILLAIYLQQTPFDARPSIGRFPIGHLENSRPTSLTCSCEPGCRSCSSRGSKAVVSHLLLKLFPALLRKKHAESECTLLEVDREADVLWFVLDIDYSRLWAALMSTASRGDSTTAIRTYCRLVAGSPASRKLQREHPATLRVEQGAANSTRIGFVAWRSS